jgi:hypothetical protein
VILDRYPFFGAPAAPPVIAVREIPPRPPAPPFTDALRMTGLTQIGEGARVTFVDARQRPAHVYRLATGDVQDGIRLAEVDFDGDRARLTKGTESGWITLGEGRE